MAERTHVGKASDERVRNDDTEYLSARGVSVHFEGLAALANVDLTLRHDEILGLIGPNGAGKTTLVNVLSGIQRPNEGAVSLNGRNILGLAPYRLARAGLARTFQAVRLFNQLTVNENVEVAAVASGMGRRAAQRIADHVITWLGLGERRDDVAGALPYGLERRVGIARALASQPRFLLLDEPAAGLNTHEAEELMHTISDMQREFDCGILVIEHNMQLIMGLCYRVHVLNQGRTIAEGSPDDVRRDPEVREAYLGSAA